MLVGPNGEPIQKKWEDMTADEKLLVVREGIGFLMRQGQEMMRRIDSISNSIDTIIEAIEEGVQDKPKSDDGTSNGGLAVTTGEDNGQAG